MPATWTDHLGRTSTTTVRLPFIVRLYDGRGHERRFGSLERARAAARSAGCSYSIFFDVGRGVGRFIEKAGI